MQKTHVATRLKFFNLFQGREHRSCTRVRVQNLPASAHPADPANLDARYQVRYREHYATRGLHNTICPRYQDTR